MRHPRCALVTSLLLACSSFAPICRAQTYPAAEAYMGFTVVNNEYGTDRHNSPGVQFNFGYAAARHLRAVADFSTESHSANIVWTNGRHAQANDYQLLFGPEFALRRNPEFTPFVHGLAGVAWRHYAVPSGNWICSGLSCYEDHIDLARETGFASGVGGGLDWLLWQRVSLRLVQVDWIRSNMSRDSQILQPPSGQFPILKSWQDSYRFSCGVVFRFGMKGHSMNVAARNKGNPAAGERGWERLDSRQISEFDSSID